MTQDRYLNGNFINVYGDSDDPLFDLKQICDSIDIYYLSNFIQKIVKRYSFYKNNIISYRCLIEISSLNRNKF
jgi:hypothetical protein